VFPSSSWRARFTDCPRRTRIQDYHQTQRLHKRIKLDHATNAPGVLSQPNFTRRSIREQQTVLSLAQFANANPDLDLGSDRVENLVGALIVSPSSSSPVAALLPSIDDVNRPLYPRYTNRLTPLFPGRSTRASHRRYCRWRRAEHHSYERHQDLA